LEEDIFKKIKNNADKLNEHDINTWILPSLMVHYDSRLNKIARRVYGSDINIVSLNAVKEESKKVLKDALNTFFFKKEHWKNGRNLNTYLLSCLKRLSISLYWNISSVKKISVPTCPICKIYGRKEILISESGMLRCQYCTEESNRLSNEIEDIYNLQSRINLYEMFSLHSRKGYRCPDCLRFIPESIIKDRVICPYPSCIYIGNVKDLTKMAHPTGTSHIKTISLNNKIGDSKESFQSLFKSNCIGPDICINMKERINKEYNILLQVINDQISSIKRNSLSYTIIQKSLMYQAYKNMLDEYPEDMISYLVHLKQNSDFPIQARIFQEYAKLVENHLPFTIKKCGKDIDIISLTSPDLALFDGKSEFEACVDNNHIIPNKTKEEYIGGRNFKNYGRCFIGKVINVIDKNSGKSLKKNIEEYSFVKIKMDNSVSPGLPVIVKHFRILPHYDMHSMVYLQRIRRNIVDSTYFRLHKVKRVRKYKNVQHI